MLNLGSVGQRIAFAVAFFTVLGSPVAAHASTILELSFSEVSRSSEIIIEATVESSHASFDANGQIWTTVQLAILDVLAGSIDTERIVIRYLGGTVGGRTLSVDDLVVPEIGERGIYFVQTPKVGLVHPLTGWQQGHFQVQDRNDGELIVASAVGRPIVAIDATQSGRPMSLAKTEPRGVFTSDGEEAPDAILLDSFKATVLEARASAR